MNEIGAACEIDSRRTGLRCFRGHLAERFGVGGEEHRSDLSEILRAEWESERDERDWCGLRD